VRPNIRRVTLTFLLTSLVICVSPGTGALFSIAAGLSRGARAGVLAAFACTLGVVPHMVAAITGLAALLHASGVAFAAVKYLGVAYLLYLAWSTWRDTGALRVERDDHRRSARQVIVSGVTVNLLNPKLTVFFFAFLPQFVPAGTPHSVLQMLALSAVFMAMTFGTFVVYGLLAAATREKVLARPHLLTRMRKVFAACFLALSGRLALESR
jgi:threonine/homoserine/homoserine lactone efflux protein